MDFKDSSEEAAWRLQVREWLEQNAPRKKDDDEVPNLLGEESEDEDALIQRAKEWQQKLYDAGYAAITWPKEYGGRDATPMESFIFSQEMSNFDVPTLPNFQIGIGMIGPTIMSHGTEEQKERFLPKMLAGEELWCQLWSEPAAGSDVASLETRAERDTASGDWVINGQKVWTTGAHFSDWGLIIARTDPDAPKHRGITAFIVDMKDSGVEPRPLRQMNGAASFNEVFFTDVHVTDEHRVGDENDGWRVALTTLMNERYAIGVGGRSGSVGPLVRLAKKTERNGKTAYDDPTVRQEIAETYIHSKLLQLTGFRSMTKIKKGGIPGPEGSAMKLVGTGLASEVADIAAQILGPQIVLTGEHAPDAGQWAGAYLGAPGIHIAGGTDDIMRNIIGERVLGLPKEPSVDRDVPFREMRKRAREVAKT